MRYFGFKRKVEVNNESGRPPYQKGEGPAAFSVSTNLSVIS